MAVTTGGLPIIDDRSQEVGNTGCNLSFCFYGFYFGKHLGEGKVGARFGCGQCRLAFRARHFFTRCCKIRTRSQMTAGDDLPNPKLNTHNLHIIKNITVFP